MADAVTSAGASVVTVGTFDGVHRGHQAILQYLARIAERRGVIPTLVTFDPHPREVVQGTPVPLLTTPDERARLVADFGVSDTVVLPFDLEMARMPAETFVAEVLVERLQASAIVIGYDHGFGAGRRGNKELLSRLGPEMGFEVDVVPAEVVSETVVSSSVIRRKLIDEGAVGDAAGLLGRPYGWTGTVVKGDQRGRTIGFPTANLFADNPRKIVPKNGVYAVRVNRREGGSIAGMMNIGIRPTFDGVRTHLEVHLFDFDEDLYGETLTVSFVERLREERRFEGVEALIEQLRADESRCRRLLTTVL